MDLPVIRTSERSSFKRCPQQWWWGWQEGLRRPEGDGGFNAADFGTGIHLALAEYYTPGRKRGADPRGTWRRFIDGQRASVAVIDDDGRRTFEDAADLGVVMLEEYRKEYGDDDDWEVIAPEQTFSVLIPNPYGGDQPFAKFVGTIDLVVRRLSDGKLFIVDHKTCQGIPTSFEWLDLDDQNAGYSAVATWILREMGLIGPKESVRGMIYNYLRKARPDERPINPEGLRTNKPQKKHYLEALAGVDDWTTAALNKLKIDELESVAAANHIEVYGEVSKIQPTPRFHREVVERTNTERRRTIKRLGEEVIWMNSVRTGGLPIIKRTSPDCKFCDFFDLCTIDEQGGDVEYFKETAFVKHDPYADHRDGAVNSKTSVDNKRLTGAK